MLTEEQANQLINDGALSWQQETMGLSLELTTILEFLVCARALLDKAISQVPWRTSTQRYKAIMEAAGVLRLTLQHHGVGEYNTWLLKRALHSTQAEQRGRLLQTEFIRKECAEHFKTLLDAATHDQPIDVDAWAKLKSCLERLGVPFS